VENIHTWLGVVQHFAHLSEKVFTVVEAEGVVDTVTTMMTTKPLRWNVTKNTRPCLEMSTRCNPNPYILPMVTNTLTAAELLETRKAAVAFAATALTKRPTPIWRANTAGDYMRVLKSRSLLSAVNTRRPDQSAAITDLKTAATATATC
jgi:hypothetical protein